MRSLIIALIITILIFTYGYAGEYIIQKDDTLWDISDLHLQDPFLWPKLWSVNPHIEDPDLIFPGEKIIIPSREELMKMTRPKKLPPVFRYRPRVEKVRPVVVVKRKESKNYLVSEELFRWSGWISPVFSPVGEITYSPGDHTIVAAGDTVYIKVYDDKISDQDLFFTVRKVKVVKHPVTGKRLGYHLRITGIIEITGKEEGRLKGVIKASYEDIIIGEKILPFSVMEPPLVPENPRTPDMSGYIVESHTNTYLNEEGGIVFLDRGKKDGLMVGDIFSVYSDESVKRSIGKIQIVALQDTTSSAVVVDQTDPITIGKVWGKYRE